jgi:succinoglycan biosynthesis protein ExoO
MTPEVSVIIPTYNTEAYIAQAIESALGQTQKNIEVIVVDDASTDATAKVARGFNDERLKVLVNQQNLGPSGARNCALREAKGKWVAVLDSDDWYAPKRLEKLLQLAYTEDADMVADDLHLIRDGEQSPWSTLLCESGEQIDKIRQIDAVFFVETDRYGQRGLRLGLSKPLFKRDFLMSRGIEYDETIRIAEDFWLYLKCLVHGARFFLLPEPYYFYRSRQGSLVSQSKVKNLDQYCQTARNFLQQYPVKNNNKLVLSLSKNLEIFEKNRAYYRVVEPLKEGELLIALIAMIYNPYFFVHFIQQIQNILGRRLQYYFLGNKSAYDIIPQKSKM